MEEKIREILEYSVWAPSGDNSQPWYFKVQDNKLSIFYIKDADNVYLNFKNGGTLIAHGCLLENVIIAASNFGLAADINYSKQELYEQLDLVAEVMFEENLSIQKDSLFEFIKKRHTNRNNYKNQELDFGLKETFQNVNKPNIGDGGVKFYLIDDRKIMEELGKAGADAEIVILENQKLHEALFKGVIWTKAAEKERPSGLYINSMEFNPIQKFLFWLASFWSLMRVAIKIGFPRFIAKEDSIKYASGAFLGLITTKGQERQDFIDTGRVLQRLWLIATSKGLAFQPIIAMAFLGKMQNSGLLNIGLSSEHADVINQANQKMQVYVGDDESINVMFRVGYGNSVSDRTSRFPVAEKIKTVTLIK